MAGKAGFEPTIIVFQDYCFTDVTVRLTIVTEEYFKQCLFLNFFPIMLTCTPTLIRTENNSFGDCHDNRFTIDVFNTNMSKIICTPYKIRTCDS